MARKSRKKDSQTKKLIFTIIGLIILVILIVTGFYFYRQYKESQIESEGLIVCNKEGICEKSMGDIHATLLVSICGKKQDLPKEKGKLNEIHTHKDKNLLHFHDRLKVDRQGNILDPSPLTLSTAIEKILDLRLTNTCLGNYCNGSSCPNGKSGNLNLLVNGQEQDEIANYVWQDDDKIELTFE